MSQPHLLCWEFSSELPLEQCCGGGLLKASESKNDLMSHRVGRECLLQHHAGLQNTHPQPSKASRAKRAAHQVPGLSPAKACTMFLELSPCLCSQTASTLPKSSSLPRDGGVGPKRPFFEEGAPTLKDSQLSLSVSMGGTQRWRTHTAGCRGIAGAE